jgi:hypothetical protein
VDERPKEPPRPRATGSADGDARKISAGLNLLLDLDYLGATDTPSGARGGRPKTTYVINPKIKGGSL